MKLPDVDIDFADRFQVLEIIKHVKASQVIDGHRRHHNSGVYLQRIPHDLDGIAGLDYKTAEGRGYFKFDLLNNGAVLAIIRPGKRYLLNSGWEKINQEVWTKVDNQYSFKKSHAVAYAILIVAVLNKLTS